jgi:beta-lactamase class D
MPLRPFRFTLTLLAALAAAPGFASTPPDATERARAAGYDGVGWLLADAQGEVVTESGGALLDRPLLPASSIKPLIALVALETGVLRSRDEIVAWNGVRYPSQPDWEKDMALDEAMRSSSEPYFRELAKRIGHERLSTWVARINYGNARIGAEADRAWLDGALRISPRQQLEFMTRLQAGELPFNPAHRDAVVAAMRWRGEGRDGLFGKSGTAMPPTQADRIGWWAGWAETDGVAHPFVLVVPLKTIDGRPKRIALADRLLADAGVAVP